MNLSDMVPPGQDPGYLMRRLADLEREVRELTAARGLESATIGAGGITVKGGGKVTLLGGGGVDIQDGGGITSRGAVRFINGANVEQLYFGPIFYGSSPAGIGMLFRRTNGQLVLSLEGQDPSKQFLAIRDNEGNIIFSDDAGRGQGIARPWLPLPWSPSNYAVWSSSESAAFVEILETRMSRQQPKLYVLLRHTADASDTTGEVRLTCNGTQLGPTVPVGFVIAYTEIGPLEFPAGDFSDILDLRIEARRTAGTGKVRAAVAGSWTQQT